MSPFSCLILFILVLSLFFLVNLARGLSILFYPFKEPALCFIYFLTLFYLFFKLCYFLLLTLGFVFSSFSNSFRWQVRLFEIFAFLRKTSIAMNFPPITAFAVSYKFCMVFFNILCLKVFLNFLSYFLTDLSIFQQHVVQSSCNCLSGCSSPCILPGWQEQQLMHAYRSHSSSTGLCLLLEPVMAVTAHAHSQSLCVYLLQIFGLLLP